MYGVGKFVGPALGGLFAQFGAWRLAFVAMAVIAAVCGAVVPRVLPRGERSDAAGAGPCRVALLLVTGHRGGQPGGGAARRHGDGGRHRGGAAAGGRFVAYERRSERGSSRARLTGRVAAEVGLPDARAAGLRRRGRVVRPAVRPAAGRAAPARGRLLRGGHLARVVADPARQLIGDRSAPYADCASSARCCSHSASSSRGCCSARTRRSGWWSSGCRCCASPDAGIGLAYPHLSVAAMAAAADPEEGRQAAAAIATVTTMSIAFGTAVAGVLVSLGGRSMLGSARWLFGFAVLCAIGIFTARAADRSTAPSGRRRPTAARSPRAREGRRCQLLSAPRRRAFEGRDCGGSQRRVSGGSGTWGESFTTAVPA